MTLFTLKAGSVPGADHLFRQANCQDRYRCTTFEFKGQVYRAGIVCDGCGSADASEVGAALLSEFGIAEVRRLIEQETPLEQLAAGIVPQQPHLSGTADRDAGPAKKNLPPRLSKWSGGLCWRPCSAS